MQLSSKEDADAHRASTNKINRKNNTKMRKNIHLAIWAASLFAVSPIQAQDHLQSILDSIEHNNTTLTAFRKTVDAEKQANRTDIFLEDPEVGVNYLWGSPLAIGNRTDISASQSFDMATVLGKKRQLARSKDALQELSYFQVRMNILLEAKYHYIDIIYANSLLRILDKRLEQADRLVELINKKLEAGEGNQLEYNDVRLARSSVKAEMMTIQSDREAALSQLRRLNGGKDIEVEDASFPPSALPSDFTSWVESSAAINPLAKYVRQETDVTRKSLAVAKASALPTISMGYMSEKVAGEHFQGISLGMSVPLWSNKNRIKKAKADIAAAEERQNDVHTQVIGQLKTSYRKAQDLQRVAEELNSSLQQSDNTRLLDKAMQEGAISIIDYLKAVQLYYDHVGKALEAERDYQKALAELSAAAL